MVAAAVPDQYLTQSATNATAMMLQSLPGTTEASEHCKESPALKRKSQEHIHAKSCWLARKAFKNLACLLDCVIDKAS